jgi:VWFA-related protein
VPSFGTEVNYVEVDAAVTDAHGGFVADLRSEDFELLEDGKPQDVSTFSLVDLPAVPRPASPRPAALPLEPDVRRNDAASIERVLVLVLDDLHTGALRSASAKRLARQFIERYVGPRDLVSVIHTSGRSGASQEFTQSPSLLLASVEKFQGGRLRSTTLEQLDENARQRDTQNRADIRMRQVADPLDVERARQAESLLRTLQRLGDELAETRGRRKSVVLISEGIDYDLTNSVGQTASGISTFMSSEASSVLSRLRQAISALTRGNVTLYGIDPSGLATGGETGIEVGAFPETPLLGLSPTAVQDEMQRSQDSLRVLSEETGGVASVSSNDFSGAFGRILRDNSRYYLLGYHTNDARRDGRFRKIEVRVKRPDLRVQARKGYFAPLPDAKSKERAPVAERSKAASLLREVLDRPVPLGGIPLRAFGAPFKGAGGSGSLFFGLEADAGAFSFAEKDGLRTDTVESAIVVVDAQGKVVKRDDYSVALQLLPETYEAVRGHGLRLLFRLELPPGRYQVRAAVLEATSVGSVHYDVQVPDFAAEPLALSGLVLTSTHAARTPTPRLDADLQPLLGGPPSAAREFATDESVALAFALYHDPKRPPGAVDIVTTVAGEDGGVRFRNAMRVSEDEFRGSPEGFGYLVKIPVGELRAGAFLLKVEATSPTLTRTREIPFAVAPAVAN